MCFTNYLVKLEPKLNRDILNKNNNNNNNSFFVYVVVRL